MNRFLAIIALASVATALSGCAGPRRAGPPPAVIERVLKSAPGAAQPSTVVATEIAFAQAAAATGQANAFRQFAAEGAIVHTRAGVVPATGWLAAQRNSAMPTKWRTRAVTISCDSVLAASIGRFTDPDGIVGNYVTIWQRQADNSYRWVYHVAGPDVPQPPPRPEINDGDIVVTALDAVQGLIASCPRPDAPISPPPPVSLNEANPGNAHLSRDGTLRWRWEHRADGQKYVSAQYFYEGEWLTAIEESLASLSEE